MHKGERVNSISHYGATLVTLYTFSTLYHSARGKAKSIFQKLDHTAIYLLIAGTYTPFTLVTLRGARGWTLFSVIWGLAIVGLSQDILLKKRNQILSVSLYVLMGWLALTAIRPLVRALPTTGVILLIAGGIMYTIGIIFYALDKKMKHSHGIFHLFVRAGSACHYFTILLYVA
jgi:hemolysin III